MEWTCLLRGGRLKIKTPNVNPYGMDLPIERGALKNKVFFLYFKNRNV